MERNNINCINKEKMRKHIYWIVLLITVLSQSCSAPYHFDKFQKKGGKIEPVTLIDSVSYETIVNGKDTTIFVPYSVDCPEVTTPKTNVQVRQEERTKRNDSDNALKLELAQMKLDLKMKQEENDSLKIVNKTLQKEIKQQGKTDRNDSDNNRRIENNLGNKVMSIFLVVLVLVVGFLVLRFLINKAKKIII